MKWSVKEKKQLDNEILSVARASTICTLKISKTGNVSEKVLYVPLYKMLYLRQA